jgi:large subunit ribosomal protein L21
MYAVIETGGMQFRAEKESTLIVPRVDGEVGNEVELSDVLLVSDGRDVVVGRPRVDGAKVKATILAQGKADKVVVFKLKRRLKYRRKRGHRQPYTKLMVTDIVWPGSRQAAPAASSEEESGAEEEASATRRRGRRSGLLGKRTAGTDKRGADRSARKKEGIV